MEQIQKADKKIIAINRHQLSRAGLQRLSLNGHPLWIRLQYHPIFRRLFELAWRALFLADKTTDAAWIFQFPPGYSLQIFFIILYLLPYISTSIILFLPFWRRVLRQKTYDRHFLYSVWLMMLYFIFAAPCLMLLDLYICLLIPTTDLAATRYLLYYNRTKSLCEVTFETIPQTFTMIIIAANTALAQIDSSLYFYSLSASFLNLFWQLSLIYTGGKQTQLGMKQYVWKFYIMQGVDMLPFQNAIIQNNISELKIREALSEKEWNSLIDSLFFNFTIVDFDIKGVKLHNPTWVKLFASLDNNNLATLNLADCKIFDPDIMKSNHESRSRQLPSAWAAANDDDDESQKSKSNSKQQSSGSDDLAENDLENELDNEFQMRANESGMRSPQMSLLAKLAPIIEARLSKQSDDNIDNVETDAHQTMDTSHRSSTMPTETDNTRASSMRASEMIKIAIDQPHDPRVTEWLENNFRDRTVSAMLVQSKAIQDSGNVSAAKQRLTNIELELLDMKQHQQDMTVKQQTARTNEALRSLLRHLSKTLLTLDLSCNHLSSSFGVITPQISKMSRLKELYLSNNNLGSIEFTPRQLVTLFRGLKQLVIIDFSNNNLTDYHVEKFIFAFEKLKKLTEKKNRKASTLSQYSVDLQMTDTNEVGTSTIETNIEQNNENTNLIYLTHLKTLDLSENKITFAGATKLFNVLKSYNDLSIVLNGNDIEDCDFNKLVVHAAVSSLL